MFWRFVLVSIALVFLCAALSTAHAMVEYGASAGASVDIAGEPDWYFEDNPLWTHAWAHVEMLDVLVEARVRMNEISCLARITDIVDSNALTYSTFFWDTFTVTSTSLDPGSPTTVTFLAGLDAALQASSGDSTVVESDVFSSMVVGVHRMDLALELPVEELFYGSALLDAVKGLETSHGLTDTDFDVAPVSPATGYSATLSEFTVPIDINTTVGSQFSLRFSVDVWSSVAPDLSDAVAIADLRDSLRIVEIQTDDGVGIVRASGAPIPPVPVGIAPVLAVVFPIVGTMVLAKRLGVRR